MEFSLAELLDGKNENDFAAKDLSSMAHDRWSLKEHHSTGVLFEAAARVHKIEFKDNSSEYENYLRHYCRAGRSYSEGAFYDNANPILMSAIEHDWSNHTRHLHELEWCYFHLLVQAAEVNDETFASLYRKARAHCVSLGRAYPGIKPYQEKLLELATQLGLAEIVEELTPLVNAWRPQDSKTVQNVWATESELDLHLIKGQHYVDLRQYAEVLDERLGHFIEQFVAEHPNEQLSALALSVVVGSNKPHITIAFDTSEHSDAHVKAYPDWNREDEHGMFCANPYDFKYEFANFDIDECPSLGDEEMSHIVVRTANEKINTINMGEGYDGEKKYLELVVEMVTLALKSTDHYKLLNRDPIFRMVIHSHPYDMPDSWLVGFLD